MLTFTWHLAFKMVCLIFRNRIRNSSYTYVAEKKYFAHIIENKIRFKKQKNKTGTKLCFHESLTSFNFVTLKNNSPLAAMVKSIPLEQLPNIHYWPNATTYPSKTLQLQILVCSTYTHLDDLSNYRGCTDRGFKVGAQSLISI